MKFVQLPWRIRENTPSLLSENAVALLPNYTQRKSDGQSRKRYRYIAFAIACLFYGFLFALLPPAFLVPLMVPFAILLILIIWALPVRESHPARIFMILFWCFWVSLYLWPNYLALALPGLPWITVNRLFGGPLLFLLLVYASSSRPFRTEMLSILGENGWIWKMVAAFSVSAAVSTIFSPQPFNTFNRYINLQIVWTSIFFVSIWVFRRPGAIQFWARLFVIMAVITSIIGLLEARRRQILWADSIPSFLKVDDPAVQRLLAGVFRFEKYRISSTTMSPLSFAEFLALSTPFLIYFFMTSRKLLIWILLISADVLIFVAIYNTDARLGMVGFLLSHSTYGFLWALRRWRSDRQSIFGPAITLAYPILLTVFFAAVMAIGRLRMLVLGDGSASASNASRQQQYIDAVPFLARSPLFGYGSGQGGPTLGFTGGNGVVTIDSYLISIALDYGIIGFVLFYGLIIGGLVKASKLAGSARNDDEAIAMPIAICFGVFLVIKVVLSQESNIPIMFMMLGAVAVLNYRSIIQNRKTSPGPSAATLTGLGVQV